MSYFGDLAKAKADAKAADMQIDGLEPGSTSPVRDGSSDAGGAPLSGKKEFSTERTRPGMTTGTMRREYPTEGASKK